MPRFHDIWDNKKKEQVRVQYTAEEEAAQDAYETKVLAGKPLKSWQSSMDKTDVDLPRWAEDIIDVLTPDQQANLATETMLKYDDKKTLRSQRPE